MEFRGLGLLEVLDDDGRRLQFAPGKETALLALLLLHRNTTLTRDQIFDGLWGEAPPENARKSVQLYISHLRKKLGSHRIETTPGGGYSLRVGPGELDLDRFETLAREGANALERAELDEAERMLDDALALWSGDPLPDVRFEAFAQSELRRLDELHDSVVADRVDVRIAAGRSRRVIAELEAIIERSPLWERPRAQLMRALYLTGRQSDALELYRRTRALLREELGVEPGPELQQLEHAILTQDPELGEPAAPPRPTANRRRRVGALLLVGGALVAVAATAAAIELRGRGGNRIVTIASNSVVAIDPSRDRIVAQVSAGSRPSRLAGTTQTIWALSNTDGTITQIDAKTAQAVSVFGPASSPADLAATPAMLWVGNTAIAAKTPLSGAEGTSSLSRFTPGRHVLLGTSVLPHGPRSPISGRPPEQRFLVAGGGLAWAVAPDGAVVAVDRAGRVRHRVDIDATSLAYGSGALWVLTQANQAVRVDGRTGRVTQTIEIPSLLALGGLAVGSGAVWVTSPFQGVVWRIDPGPPASLRTIPLSFGASTIAAGNGAVWVGNAFDDSIERIDPTGNTTRKVASVPSPQDIVVAGDHVWVAAGSAVGRSGPLVSAACERVAAGAGRPDVIVASDFDLEGSSSSLTRPLERAVEAVFKAHGFRAGRFTVGLQSCDDASRAAGGLDIGQCLANARAYALDTTVVGVIGDQSPCATAQIPILSRAPAGPVAIVSPISTAPFLTTPPPGPAGAALGRLVGPDGRNFVRTVGADHVQVGADAKLAKRLHIKRIAVVYNRLGLTSQAELSWFRSAAAQLGDVQVVPVVWNENGEAALERAVRAAHADGAFLTGAVTQGPEEGVEALNALHRALPVGAPVIVTDWLTPWSSVKAAGAAYDGVYATLACNSLRTQITPATRKVLDRLPAAERVPCLVAPAVQAAKAMLAAVARSDGTRPSVTHALLTSGLFDPNGDLVNAPVTVFRLRRGAHNDTGLPYVQDAVVDSVIHAPPFASATASR